MSRYAFVFLLIATCPAFAADAPPSPAPPLDPNKTLTMSVSDLHLLIHEAIAAALAKEAEAAATAANQHLASQLQEPKK